MASAPRDRSLPPLLAAMLRDMEEAPREFKPTNFWASGLAEIVDDIERLGVASFRAHPSALSMYYGVLEHPRNGPALQTALAALEKVPGARGVAKLVRGHFSGELRALDDYRVFRAADTDAFPLLSEVSESEWGGPSEFFVFEGKRYSSTSLRYLKGLAFAKKYADLSGMKTVLEIGGGFGSLGEIILKAGDKAKGEKIFYVDVDIPPVGYVSTEYLQNVFGKDRVADYLTTRDMAKIDLAELRQRYDAVVLCPWQLPKVTGTVDLFVNFISFQEMEPDVVANYARHVTRLGASHLLLRNSIGGKKVVSEGEVGVLQPIVKADYIEMFDQYRVVHADTACFGDHAGSEFASELSLYRREERVSKKPTSTAETLST